MTRLTCDGRLHRRSADGARPERRVNKRAAARSSPRRPQQLVDAVTMRA